MRRTSENVKKGDANWCLDHEEARLKNNGHEGIRDGFLTPAWSCGVHGGMLCLLLKGGVCSFGDGWGWGVGGVLFKLRCFWLFIIFFISLHFFSPNVIVLMWFLIVVRSKHFSYQECQDSVTAVLKIPSTPTFPHLLNSRRPPYNFPILPSHPPLPESM